MRACLLALSKSKSSRLGPDSLGVAIVSFPYLEFLAFPIRCLVLSVPLAFAFIARSVRVSAIVANGLDAPLRLGL
jgi:hypothetical protein